MPVEAVGGIVGRKGAGIILGLSDRHYRRVIPRFREAGFSDYFIPTEYNKRAIANQLRPRPLEEMTFEVNVADHCNLDCTMCDHYSQLSEEKFLDAGAYERDISRMAALFGGRIACVTLLGGEPTLHPQLIRLMEITRRHFPEGQVILLTNGLLLPRLEKSPAGNLWRACREHRVDITVTVYPINVNYDALERKAAEYDVRMGLSSNIHADKLTRIVKSSDKHVFDLSGEKKPVYFPTCLYFNKFNVLKDGRLYMCPVSAHIDIFNKYFKQNLRLQEADSLDIHKADRWERFAEFTANPVPFCRYCDLKNWHTVGEWKRSSRKIEEYV
jgi:MoaA/NifB/PqqE/SkfB family radical SAM enzyme